MVGTRQACKIVHLALGALSEIFIKVVIYAFADRSTFWAAVFNVVLFLKGKINGLLKKSTEH